MEVLFKVIKDDLMNKKIYFVYGEEFLIVYMNINFF